MARKKLESMNETELEQEYLDVDGEVNALRERKAEIQAERDRRAAQTKLDRMTKAEKQTLVQMIQAEGIESAEDVGAPKEVK